MTKFGKFEKTGPSGFLFRTIQFWIPEYPIFPEQIESD
jgi:hypothetical protein